MYNECMLVPNLFQFSRFEAWWTEFSLLRLNYIEKVLKMSNPQCSAAGGTGRTASLLNIRANMGPLLLRGLHALLINGRHSESGAAAACLGSCLVESQLFWVFREWLHRGESDFYNKRKRVLQALTCSCYLLHIQIKAFSLQQNL